jgi:hypothetical protein
LVGNGHDKPNGIPLPERDAHRDSGRDLVLPGLRNGEREHTIACPQRDIESHVGECRSGNELGGAGSFHKKDHETG